MLTIIDYGSGNLKSISNGFLKVGTKPIISNDIEKIANSDYLVLPGVGSFGSAMKHIEPFKDVILEHVNNGKPFLGICLGLQILFTKSEESPGVKGLDIFKGEVKKIPEGHKIPHIGWNNLKVIKKCPIFSDSKEDYLNQYFYFVHSYHCVPKEDIITGLVDYSGDLTASVSENNIFATQFHPEKSGIAGLKILKNFINL
ncbi:MAG: imidazole glycerol phosphate synthase subunit HisH [Methanobrevibacter sp.]|jgi:glutamine amidotransferase|nr:imidazole glycerol phosphate synthase subunit HisH [Candidatus Methanoflexus mossambicus]